MQAHLQHKQELKKSLLYTDMVPLRAKRGGWNGADEEVKNKAQQELTKKEMEAR